LGASEPTVRAATSDDFDAIGEIYAHHVLTGVATFETTPPDREEWGRRFRAVTDAGLPFLTAELDGVVVGYAYCVQWKARPAYRHTVEDSVYLAPDAVGFKHGRWLDTVLLQRSLS
jgi:L-amino acid N-acyltransferase YncA